jgi:RNA polymerase sigma-54 factor
MVMKPSLVLKLGQHLRMTPQLQQAIRLLQMSTVDLEQEIQEALDSNLMLEEVGNDDGADESAGSSAPEPADDRDDPLPQTSVQVDDFDGDADGVPSDPQIDGDEVRDSHDELVSETVADELPVDSAWEDVWGEAIATGGSGSTGDDDDNYLETRNSTEVSLKDHLLDQITLLSLSDTDLCIAEAIIDGLDADGALGIDLADVVSAFGPDDGVDIEEVEAVLHLIQHLDPAGVAARDLRECLLIQLRLLPAPTPFRAAAIQITSDYLPQLAGKDFALLARKTRLGPEDLRAAIALIQSLNPRPGRQFQPSGADYVEPDVIVTRRNDRWHVELNAAATPRIRVNPSYAAMVRRADNSADNSYMRTQLQEARWFLKSLQQRNDTLLRVASKIVEFQRSFLEYGPEAMKPLVLHHIADALDLHESTISRVTTNKYIHTPAGVFELKYFFSSHLETDSGGEVSSTAIRALIKKLVAEENRLKPLSDSKITSLLAKQGIKVARRTIAKYREALLIPPSNERKQLA